MWYIHKVWYILNECRLRKEIFNKQVILMQSEMQHLAWLNVLCVPAVINTIGNELSRQHNQQTVCRPGD